MQVKKENFREFAEEYNEDEKFYRRLYEEERFHPETFAQYVDSLDREELKRRRLYVPAIHGKWVSYIVENENFISAAQNILVAKHNRFSPEFVHEHEFYEIFYIYSGKCENTIQGQRRICTEGDLCIIPPGTRHSIAVFDDSIMINIIVRSSTFHSTFFQIFTGHNVLSRFFSHVLYEKPKDNYLLFHTGNDEVIRSMIEDMYIEFLGHGKYSAPLLDSYLMTFWVMLLRLHDEDLESFLNTTHTNLDMLDVLDYFQEHFMDITLASAAEHFGFSVPHFSKLVKANTGRTFVKIIRDIRLEKACRALKTTDLSVSSICEIVGYENPEHFNRIFKKEFGTTPGEYRKGLNIQGM